MTDEIIVSFFSFTSNQSQCFYRPVHLAVVIVDGLTVRKSSPYASTPALERELWHAPNRSK